MKVLGISAGTLNGSNDAMCKEALMAAQEAGAEVEFINLHKLDIKHCTGCKACVMGLFSGRGNACVIKDNKPQFLSVNEILEYNTFHTRDILLRQLNIRLEELERDWHYSSLERIYFERRIYKILEKDQSSWEEQKEETLQTMKTYEGMLRRPVVMEDIDRLVDKPVRKISKFDVKAVEEKIRGIEEEMQAVQDDIAHIDRYTIDWFKSIKKKYGKLFPRRTELTGFETIAATRVINNNAKLSANLAGSHHDRSRAH